MFKPSPILQAYTLLAKEAPESPSAATAAEALRNEAAKECLEAYVSGALQNESAQTEERKEFVFEISDQQTVKFFLDRLLPENTNPSPSEMKLLEKKFNDPVPPPPPVPTMAETVQRIGRPTEKVEFDPPPIKLPRLASDKSTGAAVPAEDLAKEPDSYSNDSESKKPELTPENETPVLKGGTQAEAIKGKQSIPLRYESLPVLVNRKEFAKAIKAKARQKGIPQVTLIKSMGFTPGGLANLLKANGASETKWGTYLAEVLGSQILA